MTRIGSKSGQIAVRKKKDRLSIKPYSDSLGFVT